MVPPLDLTSARDAEALQRALTGATDVSPEIARLAGTARSVASMPVPGPDAAFVASLGARLAAEAAAPSAPVDTSTVPTNVISIHRTWPRAVAGTAAGLVAASTVLGIASQDALPGDLLYGVRGVVDGIEASIAGGDAARGRALLAQGREHITDAQTLAQRDPQSAADIMASLDDAAATVTSGEEALFTAFDADRDPTHLAQVKDFTTWASPRLATLARILPPEARSHLSALSATVDAGEARLNAALASCGADCASVTPIPGTAATSAGSPAGTPGSTSGTTAPGTSGPSSVSASVSASTIATGLPGVVPPAVPGLPTWTSPNMPGVSPWTGLPGTHTTEPERDRPGTTASQTPRTTTHTATDTATQTTSQRPPTWTGRPPTSTERPPTMSPGTSSSSHTALPTPKTSSPRVDPSNPIKTCPDGSVKIGNCGQSSPQRPRTTTTPAPKPPTSAPVVRVDDTPSVSPTLDQQIDDAVEAARDALPVIRTSTTTTTTTTTTSATRTTTSGAASSSNGTTTAPSVDRTRCAVVRRLVGLSQQAGYPLMWERTAGGWTVMVVRHNRSVPVTDIDATCHS